MYMLEQSPVAAPHETIAALPHLVLVPDTQRIRLNLREIWEYRELLVFLSWRDVKVRYRQTVLGAVWAILQPLVAMVIFSVIFGQLAKLPSDGIPYPIFTYTALLPWNLFSTALSRATTSVVTSSNLVGKVYFPRVLIPLSAMVSAIVDFFFSFLILLAMMVVYGVAPTWRITALPFLILLALAAAFGIGLWLSALNVKYRDVTYVVPFVIQIWLYASPVAYSSTLVPEQWRWLYGLNPLVGVIEGFRWALLGTSWTPDVLVLVSFVIVVLALVGGLVYFSRMEETFADVI
jgi:homopolymeric O-antigen transport system permease protein